MPPMRAHVSSGARTLPIIGRTNPHPQLAGTHQPAVSLAAIVSLGTGCMFTYLVSMKGPDAFKGRKNHLARCTQTIG